MTHFDGIIHIKANFQDMQFKHKSWQIGKMSLSLALVVSTDYLLEVSSNNAIQNFTYILNSSGMFPILVTMESHTVLLFFL